MQKLPKLLVCDMAGTTVYDGEGVVAQCLLDALRAKGITVPVERATALMGMPKPTAIRDLLGSKADPLLVEKVHRDFTVRMRRFYQEDAGVRPVDGAEAMFDRLRAAGVKVALDTGFSRDIADAIVRRLNWENRLDASITSDEVENGRPHPDMILALMRRFGITHASEVAKVGDAPADLQQGAAAGCGWIIGVTEGTHTRNQLQSCPHTHLIATVAELPALFGL